MKKSTLCVSFSPRNNAECVCVDFEPEFNTSTIRPETSIPDIWKGEVRKNSLIEGRAKFSAGLRCLLLFSRASLIMHGVALLHRASEADSCGVNPPSLTAKAFACRSSPIETQRGEGGRKRERERERERVSWGLIIQSKNLYLNRGLFMVSPPKIIQVKCACSARSKGWRRARNQIIDLLHTCQLSPMWCCSHHQTRGSGPLPYLFDLFCLLRHV